MKKLLMISTAMVAISVQPAEALPVALAVAATVGSAVVGSLATGAAIVWSAVWGQAALAGVMAGAQMLLAQNSTGSGKPAPTGSEITLNRTQPVSTGLILYGERMLGGSYIARSTTKKGSKKHAVYHSIIALACHEIEGAQEIWLGETLVWTASKFASDQADGTLPEHHRGQIQTAYKHKIRLIVRNGTESQSAISEYASAASEWKTSAKGKGVAYVYFSADFNQNLFPRGPEQIRVRARGKRVYDPRDGQTKWTANPALCARDYVLTPESFGGIGWDADDLDAANIIANANLFDEQIPLVGGGTENRCEFNGILDTGSAPKENLDRLSTSWGGWWAVENGKFRIGGAAYEIPTFDISDDVLRGSIRTKKNRDFDQQFNLVKAVFADPSAEFTPTDLPILSSDTFRAQDNDEELVRDLGEFPGEISSARGQRLMKLAMFKARRQKTADFPCNLAAWDVKIGQTVTRTDPRRGWGAKEFEITGKEVSASPAGVFVNLSGIETSADVFDWQTSEETPYVAGPRPDLPLPTDQPESGIPASSEINYYGRTGGVKTKVILESTSDNPFVDLYEFSLREQSETVPRLLTSAVETVEFEDVAPGVYVFGSRSRTRSGVWSEWAYSGLREVYGLNDTPTALTGLSAAVVAGIVTLRWNESADLDVRQGGTIEIRHSGSLNATWQTSASIGRAVSGSTTMVTLPAIAGTYLIRPTDSQGLPGPVTALNTQAPDNMQFSSLATVTESDDFLGTKTNCTVEAGDLDLDDGETAAVYLFDSAMDFGAVKTARITGDLSLLISERSDLFDSDEMFDGPGLFDGSAEAEGDVKLFYRSTQTDPAGSPVWTDWIPFDRTDVTAWALEFKAEISAATPSFKTSITDLSVVAEQPV